MVTVLLLVIIVPLMGLLISALISWNREIKVRSLMILNICNIFIPFLISIGGFFCWVNGYFSPQNIIIGNWFSVGLISVDWGFLFDGVTIIMLVVVSLVSFLVHIYSLEYMAGDPNHIKFMQYLTLFTLAMFILVTANNLVQLFIGWEGVGVCSFLLINFWDTRIAANTSALKAIIVNRIGDFGLVFGLIYLNQAFSGTFEYGIIFSQISLDIYKSILIDLIAFFLFIGAVGKSAQVFLHVWLPDAMEGLNLVRALLKFHCMRGHPYNYLVHSKNFLFGKIQVIGQSAGNQTMCKQ
jgi:NADH:ubiquinone oxidoreductase subunit 5 (subunit L)/multisubunit Na+/H+ antiporter MnhA subunit